MFSKRNSVVTKMRGAHSIMASSSAMLKKDQSIFLTSTQSEKCHNYDAKFLLSRRCFRQTNPVVMTNKSCENFSKVS